MLAMLAYSNATTTQFLIEASSPIHNVKIPFIAFDDYVRQQLLQVLAVS